MKSLTSFLLLVSLNAFPAIFIVNSTSDSIDNNPGNGICQNSFGNCSLRAAIMESNALPGADIVYLQRSTTYELALASGASDEQFGDLDILDSLTLSIINPNTPATNVDELPVIDANGIGRVLAINAISEVTIFGIVITGGDSSNEDVNDAGGIYVGPVNKFNLLNSIVIGNKASLGAGIRTFAIENLISFTDISFNFLLEDGSIQTGGAAINNIGGDTIIQNSSIHHNGVDFSTQDCFGSILNNNPNGFDLYIYNSTIAQNGTSSTTNCLSGVRMVNSSLFMVNTTVFDNPGWGIIAENLSVGKDLFVRNSIVSDNGIDCRLLNNNGTINFGDKGGGNNITSDASCNMPNISGNMENTDPKLDEGRAVYPGLVPTFIYFEPLPYSPAVDAGSPLAVNIGDADACQQFDQIIRTRPIDGDGNGTAVCDIGAVEYNYDLIFKSSYE